MISCSLGFLIFIVIAILRCDIAVSLSVTNKGIPCRGPCQWNWKYFFCYYDDAKNWDYCSPNQEVDSTNRRCLNECGHNDGTSYTWCKVKGGSWGYCSIPQGNDQPYRDAYGNHCLNYCGFYGDPEKEGKSKCYTSEKGWSPCGFLPNQPARYKATCLKESPCDRHEKSDYYWCKVGSSDWDYCSPFPVQDLHRFARA